MTRKLFTSESVTSGHPDKIADQISDAILDAILAQDSQARVAVETMLTTGRIFLAGEVKTTAQVDYEAIARRTVLNIGYDDEAKGMNGNTCEVIVAIGQQSPDISQGVDRAEAHEVDAARLDRYSLQGAGDQGLMFGYATNETANLQPIAIQLAHELAAQLEHVRKNAMIPYLGPDGKTQVTVEYEAGQPVGIDTIVISTQHADGINLKETLTPDIHRHVIDAVLAEYPELGKPKNVLINPTGRFVIGGPHGDAGLTGRKIIVDTYGGAARHGGGAFSGKDPSKVDRSAAYALRWVAKNVVAAGLADRVEIQVAYAIGVAEPVAIYVDTYGTGTVSDETLARAVRETFDLRPAAIIDQLELTNPERVTYQPTAKYGHFGKPGLPWETTDKAEQLREAANGA